MLTGPTDTLAYVVKQRSPASYGNSSNDVSRETIERLQQYEILLQTWNPTINLISRADEHHIRRRHIDDSLSLARHVPQGINRIIDLGSGGGLPAIPLGIALGVHIDLVESDRRKAAFLRTAIASLGLSGTVWCERAEATSVRPAFCVTARAFAPLSDLLRHAARLLLPSGTGLFLKGLTASSEIVCARRAWIMELEQVPSPDGQGSIIKVAGLQPRDAVQP